MLIGFPSDEGVRRNGGRPGAAQAPDAIRQVLYKLTPDPTCFDAFTQLLSQTLDLGNLVLSNDVEKDQTLLGDVLAPYLAENIFPIILGGGHETAYGHFLGYVNAGLQPGMLNWDAHADVRPLKDGQAHSGSPFFQALTHSSRRGSQFPSRRDGVTYVVAGLQGYSVARAHLAFIEQHGGAYYWASDLSLDRVATIYQQPASPVMTTFDLDAVDQAFAPGVSAPATGGLTSKLWLRAAYLAGKLPHVTSMDIVECNPLVDRDNQTARLAALTVWEVLRGLAERINAHSKTQDH